MFRRTPHKPSPPDTVFYDDRCGLCAWSVRRIRRHDRCRAFELVPQDSDAFRRLAVGDLLAAAGPSVIVRVAGGQLLARSAAVLRILDRLGGRWRLLGWLFRLVPRPLRDAVYGWVARHRYRLFGRAERTCPIDP